MLIKKHPPSGALLLSGDPWVIRNEDSYPGEKNRDETHITWFVDFMMVRLNLVSSHELTDEDSFFSSSFILAYAVHLKPMHRSSLVLGISLLSVGFFLSGCGNAPTSAPPVLVPTSPMTATTSSSLPTTPMSTTLDEQTFLADYAAMRATFTDPTADRFLSLVDTSSSPPEQFEMFKKNWSNQQAKSTWTYFLPDIATLPRLDYRVEGDWAAFYYERPSDEAGSVDVTIARMHRLGGVWKVSLQSGAVAVPTAADNAQQAAAIQEQIKTSSLLTVVPSEE